MLNSVFTPNTGNYDVDIFGKALSAVLSDVRKITGKKAVYITHSLGGWVGWATDTENIAAIVAIEPGFAPEVGSDNYKKFVMAKIPIIFYFGDYIEDGLNDIFTLAFVFAFMLSRTVFAEIISGLGVAVVEIEAGKIQDYIRNET